MNGGDIRPDRHALLEFDALLAQTESLVVEGDRARFDSDDRYRNMLAHDRLHGIDEDEVWRMTTIRPAQLRVQVHDLL